MKGRQRTLKGILTLALAALMLTSWSVLPAGAAGKISTGLTAEKMSFYDVLRLYTMGKSSFGVEAGKTDGFGITNASKALASMFTYTVGLNYTGEGKNYNFFSKDITACMGQEPYTETNLKGTFEVEIAPYHGYAIALPSGQTTEMLVYCVDHEDTAAGVEDVFHYVWKEGGRYFAVKDDGTYYKVSYNGDNALSAAEKGLYLFRGEALKTDAEETVRWTPLFEASDTTAVQLLGGTLLAGDGSNMVFAVTEDTQIICGKTGLPCNLKAISNYVAGSAFCTDGPLVCSMDIRMDDTADPGNTSEETEDAETEETAEKSICLEQGKKYLFRLQFDESLVLSADAAKEDADILAAAGNVGIRVTAGDADESDRITDLVWYGSQEYLTDVKYDPKTIEFSYTPSENAYGVAEFCVTGLTGDSSAIAPLGALACLPRDPNARIRSETETVEAETPSPETAAVTETAPASPDDAASTNVAVTAAPVKSDVPLTRAAAAVLLWNHFGSPETEASHVFNDLPEDTQSAQAILWVAAQGFIQGYGDGSFGTCDYVSREQCAVIISRVAMKSGRRAAMTGTITFCEDVADVSPWARESVSWAVQNGCYTVENNYLYPQRVINVDEFRSMLSGMGSSLSKPKQ